MSNRRFLKRKNNPKKKRKKEIDLGLNTEIIKPPKKINANWYTETYTVKHTPPLKFIKDYDNPDNFDLIYFTHEKSNNGTLFSCGSSKSKVKEKDLPYWYSEAVIYGHRGWINMKKIKDMFYIPNNHINGLFRDDFLLIKFNGKFDDKTNGSLLTNIDYDISLSGLNIMYVIAYAQVLKLELPIEECYRKMIKKIEIYNQNHIDDNEYMSVSDFISTYNNQLEIIKEKINAKTNGQQFMIWDWNTNNVDIINN